jgi:hypothetical protein
LVLILLSVGLLVIVRPNPVSLAVGWVLTILLITFRFFRPNNLGSLMGRMVGTMLILAGVLNLFIYPTVMQYQAGMTAARYVNEQPRPVQRPTLLYMPGAGVGGGSFWTYEFYASGPARYVRSDSVLQIQLQQSPQRVFTTAELADSLVARGFGVRRMAVFPYYHVSQLSYTFLNRDTRATTLLPYVLAEVNKQKQE